MMKSKPRQPPKKMCARNDPDIEECVQNGWVVVKKQIVTILIPSLPITEQCPIPSTATKEADHFTPLQPDPPATMPLATTKPITKFFNPPKLNNMPEPRISHLQPDSPVTMPSATTKPILTFSNLPKLNNRPEPRVSPLQPDPPVTMALATTKPILTFSNPPKLNNMPEPRISPLQPDPPVTMPLATTKPITTFSNPPKLNNMPEPRNPHNGEPSYRKTLKICSAPKARKLCGNLFNGHMLVNPNMRALNLERELQRAGGLNRWLVSIGLGQFVKIFRCKRVGKVQLVNLTMKKLKDMGADAVGPRRKLLHAIDCLW